MKLFAIVLSNQSKSNEKWKMKWKMENEMKNKMIKTEEMWILKKHTKQNAHS